MTTKYDDSLFDDDTKYEAPVAYDDSLFEEVPSDVSKLESLARGAASGVSLGFSDELTGGAEALGRAALPESLGGDSFKDLLQNYAKYRDESRGNYKAAEEANPSTFLTGEIAGSIAPAFLTGGASAAGGLGKVALQQSAKQLAKAGMIQGGLSGLGMSDADLTEGDVTGAVKDTAIGVGIGGVAGVAIPTVAKGLGKAVGASADLIEKKLPETFNKGKKAFELAKKGISTVGTEAKEALDKDALKSAKDLLASFKAQYKKGSSEVGEALNSNKTGIDFAPQLKELEGALNSSNLLPDDLTRIQKELNLLKDISTSETVDSGLAKATQKMEDLILKAKSGAKALGEDINFSDPENINNKFLQTIKTSKVGDEIIDSTNIPQQGTGMSKAEELMNQRIAKVNAEASQLNKNISVSEPIFDEESNRLFSTVTTTDAKGKVTTKSISQPIPKDEVVNMPTFADKNTANVLQVDIPEDEIIKQTIESYKSLGLEDLNNLRARLSDTLGKDLDPQSKAVVTRLKSEVTDLIKNSMDAPNQALYESGNKAIKDTYNAGELIKSFGPKNVNKNDLDIGLAKKLKSNSQTEEVDRVLGYLKDSDPSMVESVKELSTRNELQNILKSEGGIFGWVNPKAGAIRVGEAAGFASKKMEPITNNITAFTKNIVNADNAMLTKTAEAMKNSGNEFATKWGNVIEKATQDSTKRDRLLWSLSQQPAFRQYIEEQFKNEQTEPQN